MKVSLIQNADINARYCLPKNTGSYTRSTSFYGYTYRPKTTISSYINPVKYYIDRVFTNSLAASRTRIMSVDKKIRPYTKEIPIGKSYGWDINKDDRQKYALFLHGMGQNISNVQILYREILAHTDYAVLAPEYRSFGKNSPASLSKKTFKEDSDAAYKYLVKQKGIKPENIAIIGHSFGSLVATQLTEKYQNVNQMILVSPLDSLTINSIGRNKGIKKRFPSFIMFLFEHLNFLKKTFSDIFDTNSHIKQISTSTSIIHSRNDNLSAYLSSKRLAEQCRNLNKLEILTSGGHQMEINKVNAIVSLLK